MTEAVNEGVQELGDISDVTNSTAFVCVDNLLEEGKLVEERATHLKAKFKELHDRVLQICNHDNFLLKRGRQARRELELEKSKVEKCGDEARTDDSKIQELKRELAKHESELSVAQEKESMLQVEALELDRKKQNLTHEVEDAIAAEEARLKPQLEALHNDIRNIGDQMKNTSKEFDRLKEEREKILTKEQQVKDEIKRQQEVLYESQLEFTRVDREPERAKKQADIAARNVASSNKELKALNEKSAAQKTYLDQLSDRRNKLDKEHDDYQKTKYARETEIDAKNKEEMMFEENYEAERDRQEKLMRRVNEMEELLKAAAMAINQERDGHNRTLREKDNGLKNFKRLDQAKSDLKSEQEILFKQKEILTREEQRLNAIRRNCANSLEELKRDVDILINNFLKEEIAEKRTISEREELQSKIKDLEDEVTEKSLKEHASRRKAGDLAVKREQMSREASRNQGRVMLAKNEMKVKAVILRELSKRREELNARLSNLMEMYATVKREKSSKNAQIQAAHQTKSEHEEKIKILENELEVLRRESQIKDDELTNKRRDAHEMRQKRNNLIVEKNKMKRKLDTAKGTETELRNQMKKLNSVITHTEDEMLNLKKSYEDAVENRNYTGIQLIDRNDELCILYEKANIQEDILKRGQIMMNQRELEIRKTAIELADLQREIEILQRTLPQVRDLEEDLAQLMQDLNDERWRAEVLEKDLTDPNNTARWRKLEKNVNVRAVPSSPAKSTSSPTSVKEGTSKSSNAAEGPVADLLELTRKQQELEQRVAGVNEKLMEKDLILEEVTELANNLRKQALSGRDFTLALAKKVNNYQFGIKNKTKKMMATLSELSMVQASSIQLNAQLQKMEEDVQIARERTSEGLAPTDAVVEKLQKEEFDRQRRKEMIDKRKDKQIEEQNALALRTTAEARPNAYIPDSELGLPKPYGSHAPFRPTIQAQQQVSRFYRKGQVKDLDFDEDEQ